MVVTERRMLRQLVSLATHRLLLRAARESLPQMKKVSLIAQAADDAPDFSERIRRLTAND
jgi:hypothetical protein